MWIKITTILHSQADLSVPSVNSTYKGLNSLRCIGMAICDALHDLVPFVYKWYQIAQRITYRPSYQLT